MVSSEQIQAVVNTIVEHFDPQKVILFGSYASGVASEESDLDLLVIKETDLPKHRRLIGIGRKLSKVLVHPMDILVYTPQEVANEGDCEIAFLSKVLKEGKILYEH